MSLNKARVYVFLASLIVFAAIILYSFISIALSQDSQSFYNTIPNVYTPSRGTILDRNKEILAIQESSYNLSVWKPELQDPTETLTVIASILNEDPEEFLQKIDTLRNYVLLTRSIPNAAVEQIQTLKDAGGLRGIHLEKHLQRSYPFKEFSQPFVGYVNIDNKGLDGIEYSYNDALTQGHSIQLTLDIRLQQLLQTYITRMLSKHDARYITAVLLKSNTGEILSAVSAPSFDPNKFYTYPDDRRKNRILRNVYEPGSVFKVFSIASLLELGVIDEASRFDASRPFAPGGAGFQISDINIYGNISTQQIIQYSSNVGAAHAAYKSSDNAFYSMLENFGFGSSTGINMNGESVGIFSNPESWSSRSRVTIAIGQEIAVTSMQIAAAATSIANNGIMRAPSIVHSLYSPEGSVLEQADARAAHRVISPETARTMLRFMHAATKSGGTARAVTNELVQVAAKTGTAEVYDPALQGYSSSKFVASILCIFPYENPEYVLYLAVHEPKAGQFYGGQVAAPIAHDLISLIAHYADIQYQEAPPFTEQIIAEAPLPAFGDTMPLLIGQPKRNIVHLAVQSEFPVSFSGNGWVISQSPEAGTPLVKNQAIFIEFGH